MASIPNLGPAASNLSAAEINYLLLSYNHFLQTLGTTITYMQATSTTTDSYLQPVVKYNSFQILAQITDITENEYQYMEPGLAPVHYCSLWTNQVTPQVGDHFIYHRIEWEIRNVFPVYAGTNAIIYFRTIARRAIITPNLTAGTTTQMT